LKISTKVYKIPEQFTSFPVSLQFARYSAAKLDKRMSVSPVLTTSGRVRSFPSITEAPSLTLPELLM